jgi:uncharacterized Fe-S cluster-containing MiaB family protein
MEILGGLATSGRLFNNDGERTNIAKNKIKRHPRNEKSVYNSNGFERMTNISNSLAMDRFDKSNNSSKSGIIPQFHNRKSKTGRRQKELIEGFNSDSEFTDNDNDSRSVSSVSVSGDPSYFLNKGGSIMDNRAHERAFMTKTNGGNNYASQFDDLAWDNSGDPVSMNAVHHSPSNVKRIEAERNLALNGGYSNFDNDPDMTYGVVNKENFVHNNMMPYFKGRSYGSNPMREKQTNLMNQRKMEMFTGSQNDPTYRARTETKPLFGPLSGVTNIFGSPVMTNAMESRYVVSQNRQSELPFRQIKVTPGLGLGYNENSRQGYGDTYRVLPKTVDELRPANRPKITYGGVIVPGMKGQKGPIVGKTVKRRAERFKEYGTERMVKGLGYIKAPTLYGEFNTDDMATKNRGLLRRIQYGPAKQHIDKATPEEMRGKYKDPTRQNFKEAGPRNIILVEGQQARGESNIYIPKITKRGQDNDYIGPTGTSQISKGHAFDIITNIPDPTKRAIHAHVDRAGTAMTGSHNKGHVFNPNEMPDPTKRDVHNKFNRAGTAMTGAYNKGQAFDPNEMPDPTKRDIHNKFNRAGTAMTGAYNKGQAFDPNEMPDPTKRDIHNKFNRAGTAMTGAYNKGQAFDPNEIPDPTKRDIHNKFNRAGTAMHGSYNKGQAFDPNEMPDPTKRDVHNRYDRAGTAMHGSFNKGQAFDPNEMPDPTKRDIHNKFDRAGVAMHGSYNKGQAFDPNEMPDPTRRDIHNKFDRAGTAMHGSFNKGQAFDPNEMPDPTKRDIHNKFDRAGLAVSGSYGKGQAFDPMDVMDPTRRDIHNKFDRAGLAVSGSYTKGQAFDPTDVMDPTKRDMHNKLNRTGGGASRDVKNGYTINYMEATPDPTKRDQHNKLNRTGGGAKRDVNNGYTINYAEATPDPTKREMHSKLNRTGGGAKADVDNGYTINYENATPDPTKRDIHGKRTYINPARGNYDANRSRHDANHMVLNDVRETIAKGRAPVKSNYERGPMMDFTRMSLCDPIQINRALMPRAIETNDKLPFVNTQIPMLRSVENDRMDSHIEINLRGNPYVNDMFHKAI